MEKERKTGGVLGTIERVGNMLPHPFILFLYIIAILAVVSAVLSLIGVSAVNPTTGELVEVQNIISRDGLVWIVENMLNNFSTFAPLGLVLAMQMPSVWRRAQDCWIPSCGGQSWACLCGH